MKAHREDCTVARRSKATITLVEMPDGTCERGMVASQDIAVGKYIVIDPVLYHVFPSIIDADRDSPGFAEVLDHYCDALGPPMDEWWDGKSLVWPLVSRILADGDPWPDLDDGYARFEAPDQPDEVDRVCAETGADRNTVIRVAGYVAANAYMGHCVAGMYYSYAFSHLGAYINASCCPNSRYTLVPIDGQIRFSVHAIRDIQEGEEVTIEYGLTRDFACRCARCVDPEAFHYPQGPEAEWAFVLEQLGDASCELITEPSRRWELYAHAFEALAVKGTQEAALAAIHFMYRTAVVAWLDPTVDPQDVLRFYMFTRNYVIPWQAGGLWVRAGTMVEHAVILLTLTITIEAWHQISGKGRAFISSSCLASLQRLYGPGYGQAIVGILLERPVVISALSMFFRARHKLKRVLGKAGIMVVPESGGAQ